MFKRTLSALGVSWMLLAPAAHADHAAKSEPTQKAKDVEPGRKATDDPPAGDKAGKPAGDKTGAADERSARQKKEQGEKKGALKERVDPAEDARAQRANIAQLKQDAAIDKRNGNHIGAWAAEGDEKHAQKLLEKDEKLIQEGKTKQKVDGQTVKR